MSTPMKLRHLVVGFALGEFAKGVSEIDGSNWSPRIEEYFLNLDPPIRLFDRDGDGIKEGYPYCAAGVQFVTDDRCDHYGIVNPLNEVGREAYVQDYYEWAKGSDRLIGPWDADVGDLVMFKFGEQPTRWNHIGLITRAPLQIGDMPFGEWAEGEYFYSWETNTSPPPELPEQDSGTGETERNGNGTWIKRRQVIPARVCFGRWDDDIIVENP